MSDLLRAEIDRLTERLAAVVAERDALVDALEQYSGTDRDGGSMTCMWIGDDGGQTARAALAKVGR